MKIKTVLGAAALSVFPLIAEAQVKQPQTITDYIDYFVRQMNGGSAFPYVKADVHDGDKVKLWIGSAGGPTYNVSVFISPFEAGRDPNNPLYWSLSDNKQGYALVYEGAVLMGIALPAGKYYIEIAARNGTVVEVLTIAPGVRTIELVRGGEKLTVPE